MTSLTRGPLPARVYWTRRLLVLLVAVTLVAGVGWLLGRGSDAAEGSAQATSVSADESPSAVATTAEQPAAQPSVTEQQKKKGKKGKRKAVPVLAEPDGPCASEDVEVTPVVDEAVAGREVVIALELGTLLSPACTWQATPDELTLKIRSGQDDIWSSRECPRVVVAQDLVLRNNATTTVEVTWNSRRSDEDCSNLTDWARPGWYHVSAAALGGEPTEVQFELDTPTAAVVTRTATPTPEPEPESQPESQQQKKNQARQDAANQDG